MPNSTTIAETITAGPGYKASVGDSIENSTRNSGMDRLEGCADPECDQGPEDACTEANEPLIPRIFPVYAFI